MNKKVILDVDTGVDDALGIILAVQSGEMDIVGITTVNGNVSVDTATTNTCKILQLLGVEQQIPVVRGAAKPILRPPVFEHRVHGEDGIGGALRDMPVHTSVTEGFAPDYIIEQVQRYPGEITLIMTAPMTNLALALMKRPQLIHEIKEVIFMGGVVKGFGNVTPVAEYNMYVDPEAVKIVLHAGFPSLTLVGLDVTRQALLSDAHITELGDTPIGRYVRESTSDYMKRYFERNQVQACALHDPLAVGVALRPELVTTHAYYVDIETRSELCDGQTICDFQNRLKREPNVRVCTDVDADAFLRLFVQTLRT
ncbi:nucleoside hydrolase [Paenibacillus periandrae]|uniref:nucleoside hydrolase n=1 Tax=Paenibacillus periandrae TaxID=1761741 RepID=UPI001F099BBA|nr:nucleoside hydrolase [Paenibacillus periandrae]